MARFAAAFEADDIDGVVALLTHDVVVSMPPEPEWHAGREAVAAFLVGRRLRRPEPWRFAPARANRQPAYAYYMLRDGVWRRQGLFVIGVRHDRDRLDHPLSRIAADGPVRRARPTLSLVGGCRRGFVTRGLRGRHCVP